jgi:hypothetical protein
MKEKGKKPQIALTKRTYEKPMLIRLSPGDTQGKNNFYAREAYQPQSSTSFGPS